MNKSIKGALAAAAAGSLLLGGAGSLAYWTTTGTITGGSIDSGHLKLVAGTGAACDTAWQLHHLADAVVAYGSQKLVPGDTLTKHCSYTVSMDGDHLTANLAISAPGFDAGQTGGALALANDMTATGAFSYDPDGDGVGATDITTSRAVTGIVDGGLIDATITVAFNNALGPDATQPDTTTGLTTVLDAITVTATQTL